MRAAIGRVAQATNSVKLREGPRPSRSGDRPTRPALRGGSWNNDIDNARVAARNNNHPDNDWNNNGLRLERGTWHLRYNHSMTLQSIPAEKMAAYRAGLRRRLSRSLTADKQTALETARREAQEMAEWYDYSSGGHQPAATHKRRATTISGLFKRSAAMVARPVGVRP